MLKIVRWTLFILGILFLLIMAIITPKLGLDYLFIYSGPIK
jgi:hypothetical protein